LCPIRDGAAYDLPPLNLGFTSFVDGAPPAGPGLYFTQYFQYYTSGELKDGDGHELRFPTARGLEHHKLNLRVSFTQFIYQSTLSAPLGSTWGLDVIIPWLTIDVSPSDSFALRDNGTGIGDLLIGPYLQWAPVMGPEGPRFMHRIEFQMIFPTGKHDTGHELNPGANHFYFNPYWAATLFHTPKWTSSIRLHYLWNATNGDPSARTRGGIQARYPGLAVDDIRGGQAIHANLATAWEVLSQRLRVGLNGYFLKQITDTEVDSHRVHGRKEQVFALGPGLVYHFSQKRHLFVNTFFEFETKNRPEGSRFNVRFVQHF
jgi:hypothetical protein